MSKTFFLKLSMSFVVSALLLTLIFALLSLLPTGVFLGLAALPVFALSFALVEAQIDTTGVSSFREFFRKLLY